MLLSVIQWYPYRMYWALVCMTLSGWSCRSVMLSVIWWPQQGYVSATGTGMDDPIRMIRLADYCQWYSGAPFGTLAIGSSIEGTIKVPTQWPQVAPPILNLYELPWMTPSGPPLLSQPLSLKQLLPVESIEGTIKGISTTPTTLNGLPNGATYFDAVQITMYDPIRSTTTTLITISEIVAPNGVFWEIPVLLQPLSMTSLVAPPILIQYKLPWMTPSGLPLLSWSLSPKQLLQMESYGRYQYYYNHFRWPRWWRHLLWFNTNYHVWPHEVYCYYPDHYLWNSCSQWSLMEEVTHPINITPGHRPARDLTYGTALPHPVDTCLCNTL